MLDQYHLHVETLIVNRVLPEKAEGEFMRERKELERKYLDIIKSDFKDKQLIFIPYFTHDVINMDELQEFSNYIQ